jgi:hypothetical protein
MNSMLSQNKLMATSREVAYHDPVDADYYRTFTMDTSKSERDQMAQQLNQLMQPQQHRDTLQNK